MLPEALAGLGADLPQIAVLHQAGEAHVEATRRAYRTADLPPADGGRPGGVGVEVVPFLDDVAGAMAGSHLVVSRAGAITLAELCAAGRPGLLVPLALAGGHQASNARRLASAGAAEVLAPDAGAAELAALLGRLLADRDRLGSMARSARRLARAGAARAIADRVEHLGGRG
jgi:UDP-N-acetylglucosamine--N-acetylmuramyl-(pentapeptide) pyrophosphoryl-undecaprenol N-acetylglucosamine transferase